MTPEDAIREALEQGLREYTGSLNVEQTRVEVTTMLALFAAAVPATDISVDFSSDTARISSRSLCGTVTVRRPSETDTLAAWANAGLLANPEALGLAQYEDSDGKRFWRWLGTR